MLRPRIIPCLLVHKNGLVKTRQFSAPKYVGDPINAVKIFNEKAADELIVLDIDATTTGAQPGYALIEKLAAECRMPLCYGGGIKGPEHARRIVGLGVEKVSLSAAAVEDPDVVAGIAAAIGCQSVVVVIDVLKDKSRPSGYCVCSHNGHKRYPKDPTDLALTLQEAGVGEVVVNSVDRDGEMVGYDLDLAKRMRQALGVPLTILGGAGSLDHLRQLIGACGTVGAAAGSMFVFKGSFRAVLINYPSAIQKLSLFANIESSNRQ